MKEKLATIREKFKVLTDELMNEDMLNANERWFEYELEGAVTALALLDSITEALDSQEMVEDDIIEVPTHNFGAATTMEAVYGKDAASRLRELALEVMDEDKQRKRINKIIKSACPDDDVSKANWEEVVEYIRHLEARAAINTIQGKTDE